MIQHNHPFVFNKNHHYSPFYIPQSYSYLPHLNNFKPPLNGYRKVIQDYSYALHQIIGQGFSSKVYLGRNDLTMQQVVIKVVDLHSLTSQQSKDNLSNQISILKSLEHENLLKCYQIYSSKNNCYIITEFCQLGDLQKLTKYNGGKLSELQITAIIIDVLKGYKYLYQNNIIHRDLKSSNILLNNQKKAKIGDFGFAKKKQFLNKKQTYNVGSPMYMSPEALLKNQYSEESDIFSIGIIFYQCLFGYAPWESKSQKQLIQKLLNRPIEFDPKVFIRKQSKDFILKCLEISTEKRLKPCQLSYYIEKLQQKQNMSEKVKEVKIQEKKEGYDNEKNESNEWKNQLVIK